MEKIIPQNLLNKRFLLCVSGGADSMVLLHFFLQEVSKSNFAVVTVNHNLREQGKSDAAFVEAFCLANGVKCFTESVDVASYASSLGLSTETAARELRYKAIENVSIGFDYICLAHHADDNAETVLLHLIRGGGTRGAAGIRRFNGRYFRPLLNFTKEQLLKIAIKNELPYVTDETNALSDCNRNFIRNEVMPMLKKINPDVTIALNNFARIATEDDEFINSLADISDVCICDGQAQIPVGALSVFRVVAIRQLYKVFRTLGFTKDIETKHINALLKLAQETNGTKSIDLPFDLVCERRYDNLFIYSKKNIKLSNTEKSTSFLPFKIGESTLNGKKFCTCLCDKKYEDFQTKTDLNCCLVDCQNTIVFKPLFANKAKIPVSAIFRTRNDGDIFTKYGGGTKKLKDYLIDKKISKNERDGLVLLADGHDILAILGVEISDKVKVEDGSETICFCLKN